MIVSGAAPPMVDVLRRVRRCKALHVSTRLCRFCHARSRVPIVLGPFHYCASCERAAPDAPETIDDQRRSTGCRYRTIYVPTSFLQNRTSAASGEAWLSRLVTLAQRNRRRTHEAQKGQRLKNGSATQRRPRSFISELARNSILIYSIARWPCKTALRRSS